MYYIIYKRANHQPNHLIRINFELKKRIEIERLRTKSSKVKTLVAAFLKLHLAGVAKQIRPELADNQKYNSTRLTF